MLMRNYNDTIGNPTRDLTVCIAVPKLRHRVPLIYYNRLQNQFTLLYSIYAASIKIQVS